MKKSEVMDSLVTRAENFLKLFKITIMRPNLIHKIWEHKQKVVKEERITYQEIRYKCQADNDDILRFAHRIRILTMKELKHEITKKFIIQDIHFNPDVPKCITIFKNIIGGWTWSAKLRLGWQVSGTANRAKINC